MRNGIEEKYCFEERLAICELEGNLHHDDALLIADRQLWEMIRGANDEISMETLKNKRQSKE